MRAQLEQWTSGWSGLTLGLSPLEIDRLIVLLGKLKGDPEQHLHIASTFNGAPGLGDIEVYVKVADEEDNMHLSSLAIGPES